MIAGMIDSLIGLVSPATQWRRQQYREAIKRAYAGAESNRMTGAARPQNRSADAEMLGPFGADALRAWARSMVRDNAYAWGVVDTIVSSVIGCGIRAQSQYETPDGGDAEEINERRDNVWERWCEVCDVNGQLDFVSLTQLVLREVVEAGECLVHLVNTPELVYRGIYRQVPLALEVIEADRLASEKDTYRIRPQGNVRIVRGIELDELGKPLAYWIYPEHPNAPYAVRTEPVRVEAANILHIFRRDRVGQSRGVSWFAPVLSWIRDLGTYVDNEIQAAAVASCFGVAIKSDAPAGIGLMPSVGQDNADTRGNTLEYLEPAMIARLGVNESIEVINPGRPNSTSEPWIKLMLRGISVGTGLSYETVSRDYSGTSYSSSRTSRLEDRQRFRRWQRMLVTQLCQPIWDRFCDQAAIAGVRGFPSLDELLADRRRAVPVEWQTPEWEWVDPQSEQAASDAALASYQSTYQYELGQRGKNWRSVFYQRAKEEKLKRQLGLITADMAAIDNTQAEAQEMAAGAATTAGGAGDTAGGSVQAEALNGAQITSLVEVLSQAAAGGLPIESAKAIISAAFPLFDPRQVDAIVAPLVGKASAEAVQTTEPSGELSDVSRLQWQRNRKAIEDILADYIAGKASETKARVFLQSLGLTQATADALIADASDGTVDTDLSEAPATEVPGA